MRLPEKGPDKKFSERAFMIMNHDSFRALINKCQNEYYPWEKVKYQPLPEEGFTNEDLWSALKIIRGQNGQHIKLGQYYFKFCSTTHMQKELHEFDMSYGGGIGSSGPLNNTDRQQYLVSSLMEEAIASSQIEGAVTTRKVAKEMLRQNRNPRNQSEQMILNNYRTIEHIRDIIKEPLTEERLLHVHRLMTSDTMDDKNDEGHFRMNDDVRVVDSSDGTVMHQPPMASELTFLMNDFYKLFNEEEDGKFIHPVIRASMLHFLIGFIHPFVDGNGRTARAIFYWYMLKRGYWLTEYLSISGIILKTKTAYGKAFLDSEIDDLDVSYFLNYQLRVIRLAYESLRRYIDRKVQERQSAAVFMRGGGINERQAQILQWLTDEPGKIITVKEVEALLHISNQTARTDLQELVNMKLLEQKNVNLKKQVFMRSSDFDRIIKSLK